MRGQAKLNCGKFYNYPKSIPQMSTEPESKKLQRDEDRCEKCMGRMDLCATSGLDIKHKLCIYVMLLALKFVFSHIYCCSIAFLFLYHIINM